MIQLQSILLPDPEVCQESRLYYHRDASRVDFDGYFNLFYIEKHQAYTVMENLFLEVTLQGYERLILVHDGVDLQEIPLDPKERRTCHIEFPYDQYRMGVFWFALIEATTSTDLFREVKGSFVTESRPEQLRPVRIGIDICTYRREPYVIRNLRLLKKKLLDRKDLEVSAHTDVYLIDNGKTLLSHEPFLELWETCRDQVTVLLNKNAGGAGGFTRGMMEILKKKEEKGYTHVLLMDDDAVIEPDLLVRIYGFLSLLKEEWKDMTVGGAMLREDYPYVLFCAGEWWEDGRILNPRMNIDLRSREEAACAYLTETGHEYDRYSGWWCCCYSLNTVREDNLPLPLFIHHDDIEFGLRNRDQGIVFLNGVGVWHRGAELNFPGANLYYDVRNNLVEIALHQKKYKKYIMLRYIGRALNSATIRMKYRDVEIVYCGFIDFIKGLNWIYRQDPEQLNKKVKKISYQMQKLEDLRDALTEDERRSVEKQIKCYDEAFGLDVICGCRTLNSKATLFRKLTYNGWILPAKHEKIKVITSTNSPFDGFRYKKILLYEIGSGKVCLLRKQYAELIRVLILQIKIYYVWLMKSNRMIKNYNDVFEAFTNSKTWREYLDIKHEKER